MENKTKISISYEQALEISRHTDVVDFEAYLIKEHNFPINGGDPSYYLDTDSVDFWFIDQLFNLIQAYPIYQERLPYIEKVLCTFLEIKAFIHIPHNKDDDYAQNN